MLVLTALAGLANAQEAQPVADDPRISRSRGRTDAIVVLYPRILPASEDPYVLDLARQIHDHTAKLVMATAPQALVDVRPAPERVCPRAGCKGPSIGSVFVHHGSTCAVAAWVAAPRRSPARPIPWSPGLETKVDQVPFREPVENALKVLDYMPCETIVAGLTARDSKVSEALQALLP